MDDRLIDEEYMSVSQVSEQLGMNRQTVQRWCAAGKIEAILLPGRIGWRIKVDSLNRFLAGGRLEAVAKKELGGSSQS